MRIVRSLAAMQASAGKWKRDGISVALVPTMGYLHDGHLSLVRRAREAVGRKGRVVVSIYVNPTQFGPKEDLSRYPRDFARDSRLCRTAGVDVIFAPADAEMYPGGTSADGFSTYVVEESLTLVMEGISRPTHFRGVTTVVAKLFHLVQPDFAIFGAKDYQQAAVIQRMVRDLNFPLKIVVAPTFREKDGLAMSSRNKFLEGDLRDQAVVLWKSIEWARAAVRKSKRTSSAVVLKAQIKKLVGSQPAARLDYVEFFDPQTLRPVAKVGQGAHMALAVFIGKTRLIDNGRL